MVGTCTISADNPISFASTVARLFSISIRDILFGAQVVRSLGGSGSRKYYSLESRQNPLLHFSYFHTYKGTVLVQTVVMRWKFEFSCFSLVKLKRNILLA